MTKRSVVTILTDEGFRLLREKSAPVAFTVLGDGSVCLESSTIALIEELKQFVLDNRGLGMSAIQLGIPLSIFVMRKPWNSNNVIAVINPKILRKEDTVIKAEGCFSIPLPLGTGANVKRANKIYVEYDTEEGERITDELFIGMDARVFQHELDHLNGELMIDEKKFEGWSTI
jgi:peptide deformylase